MRKNKAYRTRKVRGAPLLKIALHSFLDLSEVLQMQLAPRMRISNTCRMFLFSFLANWVGTFEALAYSESYKNTFSPHELKTMTNDPDTNPSLATYSEKLDNAAAEAMKVGKIAYLTSQNCIGAKGNYEVISVFLKQNLTGLSKAQVADARFTADHTFEYMDRVVLAQLCAGISYMFGPQGHFLPNAVSPGTGEMSLGPYAGKNDQLFNPYVRVAP